MRRGSHRRDAHRPTPVGAVIVVVLSALATAACTSPEVGAGGTTAPRTPDQAHAALQERLYAEVVRRLVEVDHGYGGTRPPYRVVYVLDGIVPHAADPMAPTTALQPSTPFTGQVKEEIRRAVGASVPVVFVHRRAAAITGRAPGHVRNRGVLITLGPIRWRRPDRAFIPSSRYANGLNGQWATYRAVRRAASWRITGPAGPVAIS